MRPAAASVLSAAALIVPGCERETGVAPAADEALRQAVYRSLAARERLEACASEEAKAGAAYEDRRLRELKRLAAEKGAGHAFWRGENDWSAVAGAAEPPPCPPGEGPMRLAAYTQRLDALAGALADYRE